MAQTKEVKTSRLAHKVAVIFYPWATDYTSEKAADKEVEPKIYSSDPSKDKNSFKGSGIHYIQLTRNKSPGGTMHIDINCSMRNEELPVQVGAWCSLYSTSKGIKFGTREEIVSGGVLRFVGQVYSINGQYILDGNGMLRRTLKISVREWSHVLHTPLRFHPQAPESNASAAQQQKTVVESQMADYQKALEKLGSQLRNVYQYPLLVLGFVGYFNETNRTYVQDVIDESNLQNFSLITSHLPNIHSALMKDVMYKTTNKASDFFAVLSGVQTNPAGNKTGLVADDVANPKAKRPVSFMPIENMISGKSLFELIQDIVAGNGATEVYTDIQYKNSDGKVVGTPTLVIRDIPYSLKKSLKDGGQDSNGYEWTVFDNLPRVLMPSENIQSLSLKQGIENVANLITFNIDRSTFSKNQVQTVASYYGTNVLPNSQFRYGGIARQVNIRDMFALPESNELQSFEAGRHFAKPSDLQTETDTTEMETSTANSIGVDWWQAVSNRLLEFYGTANMYFDGSMTVFDNDFYLSVGNNLQWNMFEDGVNLVGHINQLDLRYQIVENGTVTASTTIGLTRICGVYKDQLVPLPTKILNSLYTFKESDPGFKYLFDNYDSFVPQRTALKLDESLQKGAKDDTASKEAISKSATATKDNAYTAISLKLTMAQQVKASIDKTKGDSSGVDDEIKRLKEEKKAWGDL